MSAQEGTGQARIQLTITEFTTPTEKISDDFECKATVKNTAKTAGRGTVILRKSPEGDEVEKRELSWVETGNEKAEVSMTFKVPITVYRVQRKYNLDIWKEGKHQLYLEAGSGAEKTYSKQDGRSSAGFIIRKPPLSNLNNLIIAAFLCLVAAVILTLILEWAPNTTQVTITSSSVSNGTLVVIEHPNMVVPIKNVWGPAHAPLSVTIYTNNTNEIIQDVTLSTNPTPFLNFTDPIIHVTKIDNTTIVRYQVNATVKHTGNVGNTTIQSSAYLAISDVPTGGTRNATIPFQWSINQLDFNQPMYFWLVLYGVITSRYVSFNSGTAAPSTGSEDTRKKLLSLGQGKDPHLWIIFSGVLALLIFAGFQDQVKLTNNVLFNLAAAFTFGFGFDKVLEKLKDVGSASGT